MLDCVVFLFELVLCVFVFGVCMVECCVCGVLFCVVLCVVVCIVVVI